MPLHWLETDLVNDKKYARYKKSERTRKRDRENTGFSCLNCGLSVVPVNNGSYRNHCPHCLWSLHVDAERPGDRASTCKALMQPIEFEHHKKGLRVVHQCNRCGKTQPNLLALDTEQSDYEAMLAFMSRKHP